ncbi:protein phosphatase 2C domain-containing protein [Bacillus sp. S10(2024)]|uniref:protein phosphatase 2C domain-containing protein n=1 Tax=Bacillus sp. S10(2024) TaxID=3162886 RepID=UPI003D23D1A6
MNMNITDKPQQFSWVGNEEMCIDQVKIDQCDDVIIGRYGGNKAAGAKKNEDGALVWAYDDWEFAMILDAHYSAESTALLVQTMQNEFLNLKELLDEPIETVFQSVEKYILSIFQSESFQQSCQRIKGETACLICVRKANYLWWLSVGDCVVYLLHDELHKLGQYTLNQRNFYEWVGFINTFSLPVPCYSSGVRELRTGHNRIVMVTDGLLECGEHYYEKQCNIYTDLYGDKENTQLTNRIEKVLQHVHEQRGRDSATIISWDYTNSLPSTYPSDQIFQK